MQQTFNHVSFHPIILCLVHQIYKLIREEKKGTYIKHINPTVTRFKSARFAPRHRPVDIPPQPEYKSSTVASGLTLVVEVRASSELTTWELLMSISLEIVDELSLPAWVFSASSKPKNK